jgi:hypothetical protein
VNGRSRRIRQAVHTGYRSDGGARGFRPAWKKRSWGLIPRAVAAPRLHVIKPVSASESVVESPATDGWRPRLRAMPRGSGDRHAGTAKSQFAYTRAAEGTQQPLKEHRLGAPRDALRAMAQTAVRAARPRTRGEQAARSTDIVAPDLPEEAALPGSRKRVCYRESRAQRAPNPLALGGLG